jgi:hypothetical protein
MCQDITRLSIEDLQDNFNQILKNDTILNGSNINITAKLISIRISFKRDARNIIHRLPWLNATD